MELSAWEEKILIVRWRLKRDQQAANRLMEAHRARVRGMVEWFLAIVERTTGAMTKADLFQQAWLGFWEAVDRFKPVCRTRLWTYARFWVRRRLIEAVVADLGLSQDGRKVWREVLDGLEQLTQEQGRLPRNWEEIVAYVLRRIRDKRKDWGEERLRRAVEEVLKTLERVLIPLVDDYDEDADDQAPPGAVVPHPAPSPLRKVINRGQVHQVYRKACKTLGSESALKWLVLWILKDEDFEDATWEEICTWLRAPDSEAARFWPHIWASYGLPADVPQDWDEVQRRFQTPPPVLTEAALRQWYHRAWNKLGHILGVCDCPDPPPGEAARG